MDLEIINKLFLELSQVSTAKTERENKLEELLGEARTIAQRSGADTNWDNFLNEVDSYINKPKISKSPSKSFRISNTKVIKVIRVSDGEVFSLNKDNETYSNHMMKIKYPLFILNIN